MNRFLKNYKSLSIAVKASGWYMACNIIQNSLGFVTLPIFTRILTTYEYGQYSVYLTWMNIITIFTTLNIQYGVFNTAMIKFEHDRPQFISSMQGLTTTISIIWFVIYISFQHLWNALFQLPTIVMIAMVAEMCFLPAKDYWCGKQRFEYRYKEMVIYTLALTFLNPLICIIAIWNAQDRGIVRIMTAAGVNVAFYLVIYIYNLKKGRVFYNKAYWKYALEFSLPLIFYYLSQMVFNQSDRIMIQHMVGTDKAGIYNLVYTCSVVAVFVINAINGAFVPWKYQKIKEKQYQDIGRISSLLSLLIGIMTLMIILCGPEIIKILVTEEYYEAIWIMPPVIGSLYFLFQSQLFINIEFYFEEKKYLVLGSLLSAGLNIVLNHFAILKWGYIAAGYTTLISYLVFAVCNYFCMKKVCEDKGIDTPIYNMKILVPMSIALFLCIILAALIYNYVWIRWGILSAFILLAVIKRRKIFEIMHSISK